jgi:hypothetical protein
MRIGAEILKFSLVGTLALLQAAPTKECLKFIALHTLSGVVTHRNRHRETIGRTSNRCMNRNHLAGFRRSGHVCVCFRPDINSRRLLWVNRRKGKGCTMEWLPLIIQLISGAVGGNVAGGLLKNMSLGTAGNSIAGVLGGGVGGYLLNMLGGAGAADAAAAASNLDIGAIISSVAGGGVGGGVLMAIIGVIKNMMAKT